MRQNLPSDAKNLRCGVIEKLQTSFFPLSNSLSLFISRSRHKPRIQLQMWYDEVRLRIYSRTTIHLDRGRKIGMTLVPETRTVFKNDFANPRKLKPRMKYDEPIGTRPPGHCRHIQATRDAEKQSRLPLGACDHDWGSWLARQASLRRSQSAILIVESAGHGKALQYL